MINRMYQLYELRDEIKTGIENLEKLLPVQEEFLKVINDSGKHDEFEFMLKDWESYHKSLPIQIDNMKFRLELINELITDYEKQDEKSTIISETVTKVLESIGATTPESSDETEKSQTN